MRLLRALLLGDGTLTSKMHEKLRAEGLLLVEENLGATVRYTRFRAPGRRHHGKIVPERVGLGISQRRLVVYCRSGRVKLIDSEWTNPHLRMVDVEVEGEDADKVVFRIDYDRAEMSKVAGQVAIAVRTESAPRIAAEVRSRLER